MGADEPYAAFRELLEGEQPSLTLWHELCERVDAWEDEDELEDRLGPYLNTLLEGWQPEHRIAHPSWIEKLLEGEHVPQLIITRTLDMRCHHLMLEDAELLAESPELDWITHLNLAYNGLQDEGAISLVQSEHVRNLEWLDLAGNSIDVAGIKALAHSASLRNLKHLDLTGNWVNDDAALDLSQSEHLQNLTALILRGNPIKAEGAKALASSPYLCEPIRHFWQAD